LLGLNISSIDDSIVNYSYPYMPDIKVIYNLSISFIIKN